MLKIKALITASFLALALVLAMVGCSGNDDTSSTPTSSTPTTSTTTTTTTPTPSTTTTTTTTTEAPAGKVLDIAPLPLEGPTHSALVAAMCNFCHVPGAPDAMGAPAAPSWAGSDKNPGPWVVTAGSDADHDGRTDNAGCVADGCHAKNW